jgi:hypothetical protein
MGKRQFPGKYKNRVQNMALISQLKIASDIMSDVAWIEKQSGYV